MASGAIENREVTWKILDIPIRGTITGPQGKGPYPAVVLLAGSGPTDRNWCSPLIPGTNGTAKLLAESIANSGFVTLRYDKLGSGPHVKESLPKLSGKVGMQTFLEELAGAVGTLLAQSNVDSHNLFALGNSEGCIHAVNYQLQAEHDQFKGLVLTGAPGRPVGTVARNQLVDQLNFLHNAKGATGVIIKLFSKVRPLPETKATMEKYDEAISQFVAGQAVRSNPPLPKGVKKLLQSLTSPTNQPFSRELWTYNLIDHLPNVHEPVLVLIGKKDIQVDWMIDGKDLENAASAKPSISFAYPANSNHLLKYEAEPKEKLNARNVTKHYNSSGARLDEEAKDLIIDWLRAHT
jgi:uncharacterized protein